MSLRLQVGREERRGARRRRDHEVVAQLRQVREAVLEVDAPVVGRAAADRERALDAVDLGCSGVECAGECAGEYASELREPIVSW